MVRGDTLGAGGVASGVGATNWDGRRRMWG